MNDNTDLRRVRDFDSEGGWANHGDGSRTYVPSNQSPTSNHAISSDGREYIKDANGEWRRSNLTPTVPIWPTIDPPLPAQQRYYTPERMESDASPAGCPLSILWIALVFIQALYTLFRDWWKRNPWEMVITIIVLAGVITYLGRRIGFGWASFLIIGAWVLFKIYV